MRGGRWVVLGVVCVAAVLAAPAGAQTNDDVFGADTLFVRPSRTPITYVTTYDRDVSSGTWNQSLSYSMVRRRLTVSTDGNYTSIDLGRSHGLGGESGAINGTLNFAPTRHWSLGVSGRFNRVASRDLVSETGQRQNRLKLNSQYSVSPLRGLKLQAVLSTEFQQDHGLTVRPLGQEQVRLLTRYDGAGDSVGVDSVFVHDQRDSTFMSGRQDGLSLTSDWRIKPWLQITSDAAGTRVRPVTTSQLRDFARAADGSALELTSRARFESPNENETYHSKILFTGIPRMTALLNLKQIKSDQQFFEKLLRSQEHLAVDQRGAIAHVEYMLGRGSQFSMDGTLDRSLSEYSLRASQSSLVSGRSFHSALNYAPSNRSRAGIDFSLDHKENKRQSNGNGLSLARTLQASGGHRLSPRFGLDVGGSVSLFSSKYEIPNLDQDNLRTYLNVGATYTISNRCSTTVHFSNSRGHIIAIDPSRSGNNNVQSTYQMDASLRLGVSPNLSIVQLYVLNALYQLYDQPEAEPRNSLSRIRRIDTTITDSLTTFSTIQLTHNFLFRDSGSFKRPSVGGDRVYNVGSEAYQQTVTVTINVRPATGVQLFVMQSLGNLNIRFPSSGLQTISNRWNLSLGGTVDRRIVGDVLLHGTVQHIGAYSERQTPSDLANEQDDWLAGVSLQKDF